MEDKKDIFDKLLALPGFRIFRPFYDKHKEILLYLFFGFLTFLVGLLTFILFERTLGFNELIANIFSWIFAVTFAFYTNRIWVFRAPTKTAAGHLIQMAKFFSGRLVTLGVEELILFVFITRLGMNSILIKIIAQVVVIVLNYVISKMIVFKKNSNG